MASLCMVYSNFVHPLNHLSDLFPCRACARAPTAHADLSVFLDEGGVQQRTQAAAELAAAVCLGDTRCFGESSRRQVGWDLAV